MKERPILFSAPMVRAILEGRKTMTRRVAIHKWGQRDQCEHTHAILGPAAIIRHCEHGSGSTCCPYGEPGDRLWVRETFALALRTQGVWYKAGSPGVGNTWITGTAPEGEKVRPSIFMPRWASRILLEVAAVRVERVQDISEADAEAEGISFLRDIPDADETLNARELFQILWDSINAKRGYGWDANPWVWVIEFRKVAP